MAHDPFAQLQSRFESAYRDRVGFILDDIAVELVSVSIGAREDLTAQRTHQPVKRNATSAATRRLIYDLAADATLDYSVFERGGMDGQVHPGPAVIAEAQTTTLVRPGWSVQQSSDGHLILERSG